MPANSVLAAASAFSRSHRSHSVRCSSSSRRFFSAAVASSRLSRGSRCTASPSASCSFIARNAEKDACCLRSSVANLASLVWRLRKSTEGQPLFNSHSTMSIHFPPSCRTMKLLYSTIHIINQMARQDEAGRCRPLYVRITYPRRRRRSPMSITLDKIEKLRATLSGLPEADESRRKVGTRKAVHLLRKDINALKRKGYTLEMIAEQLRAGGLGLSRATLKRYMGRRSQLRCEQL